MTGNDRSFGLVDTFEDLVVCVAVARGTDLDEQVIRSRLRSVDVVYLIRCVVLRPVSGLMNSQEIQPFA